MTRFLRMTVLAIVCVLVAGVPVWGQQATAVTGAVTDPTGAVIAGAEVTLTHEGTGVSRTTKTRSDGVYIFTQLRPGSYRLEVRMQGFRASVHERLDLPVGITTTLDVQLEVGMLAEQVVVEGGATLINTTDASLGKVIENAYVLGLPLEGRDPAGLLSLQPGATYIPTGTAEDTPEFDSRSGAVNGARSDQSNITLDGVDNNDPQFSFAYRGALRVPVDSLQEFRVSTLNYNAEGGRSSGSQVSLVTRSGTNEIHGSAYWLHRNEATAASEWFQNAAGLAKRKLRKQIFGVSLGGPVLKDRFFLFGNYEGRRDSTGIEATRDVPSHAMRNGWIIYQCDDGTDPRCAGGPITIAGQPVTVPNGWYALSPTELTAIDPLNIGPNAAALGMFQQFPQGNDTSLGLDGVNIIGFRFQSPLTRRFHTTLVRADLKVDQRGNHQIFWRGNIQDDRIPDAPQFTGGAPNQVTLLNPKGMALGYTAIISPALVSNFRYGYTRIKAQTAGVQNRTYVDFRFLSDVIGLADNSDGRTLPLHNFVEDLTWTVGKHTVSMGGNVRYTRINRFSNANSFPFFTTNPSWIPQEGAAITPGDACFTAACTAVPAVSGAFAESFHDVVINVLGLITQATAAYNFDRTGATLAEGEPVARRFATDEYEGYIQDQWRIRPSLTLTFGLRYFVSSPPWERSGNQVAPSPGLSEWFRIRQAGMQAGLPAWQAPQILFELGGKANNGRAYYDWDWNNFSPRIAVAWAPDWKNWLFGGGKLSIRGGYSIVYDRIGNGLITQFDDIGSFGMATAIDSEFGACDEGFGTAPLGACPRFTDLFTVPSAFLPPSPGGGFPARPPGDPDPFGPRSVIEAGSFAISTALDDGIDTPYAYTINVTVARQLPWNLAIEASYVGRRGRHLSVQRDLSMPLNLMLPSCNAMDYFTAATALARAGLNGVPISAIDTTVSADVSCFWNTLYPNIAATTGGVFGDGVSNLQEIYGWFDFDAPDYTFALFRLDHSCPRSSRTCSILGRHTFFDDQFAALSAWSTIGRGEYHAFQFTASKRLSNGVAFGFNYTLSKSRDHTSEAEYADDYGGFSTGGVQGFLVNSWDIDTYYSYSDYDMRHQFNGNWLVELPWGRGKAWGSGLSGWADQILGGWEVSGLIRINSGLPASVGNGRAWPTNWNITGNATCVSTCPDTQNVHGGTNPSGESGPNIFSDPVAAFDFFRRSLPGEAGGRNNLRGEGYFNLDMALGKKFRLPWEGHSIRFRWEVFNVTNSAYFDVGALSASLGTFGNFGSYSNVLGPADGSARVMQFGLRYEF